VPASIRPAEPADAEAIAVIYNQGIEERRSTFETRLRTGAEIAEAMAPPDPVPFLVAEADEVLGWGRLSRWSTRECYAGVGEASVYVDRAARGQGLGRRLIDALAEDASRRGHWKLVGLLFPDNEASMALCKRAGFREVGVFERHGQLDGVWRNVLIVERLLAGSGEIWLRSR
jgi:L-amino acid N-acyltransferase YncA